MKYAEFAKYIVEAPLYQPAEIEDPQFKTFPQSANPDYRELLLPTPVRRHCETCDGERNWDLIDRGSKQGVSPAWNVRTYCCKDCEKETFSVWFAWWATRGRIPIGIVKGGQYPKIQITIPKAFGDALGKHRQLYINAMTLRNNNYGIGAVVYLRRVIEDTTDDMLDLLEQHMVSAGSPQADIDELHAVKQSTRFEDKVAEAAKVLPEHFRPGGVNPFGDLYQLVSIGLHDKSDEECCAIVDGMDRALKFIYTRWKTYVDETKAYTEATKQTRAAVDKMKKGG